MVGLWGRYGGVRYSTRDVSREVTLSVDLRAETGGPLLDETRVVPAGVFRRALAEQASGPSIAEVRIWLYGQEMRLVAEYTGRPGLREITPEVVRRAASDPAFREQLVQQVAVA